MGSDQLEVAVLIRRASRPDKGERPETLLPGQQSPGKRGVTAQLLRLAVGSDARRQSSGRLIPLDWHGPRFRWYVACEEQASVSARRRRISRHAVRTIPRNFKNAPVSSDRSVQDRSKAKPDEVVQTPVARLSGRAASRATNAYAIPRLKGGGPGSLNGQSKLPKLKDLGGRGCDGRFPCFAEICDLPSIILGHRRLPGCRRTSSVTGIRRSVQGEAPTRCYPGPPARRMTQRVFRAVIAF